MPPGAVLATAVAKSAYGLVWLPLFASLPVAETQVWVETAAANVALNNKIAVMRQMRGSFMGEISLSGAALFWHTNAQGRGFLIVCAAGTRLYRAGNAKSSVILQWNQQEYSMR
jgi:hypothetical protein